MDPHEVADVYRRSGITRPIDDLPRLTHLLQHANLMISARDQGRLVGFARALTDFSYCCYLSDLAVDRDYQRRGIGKQLIHTMHKKLGGDGVSALSARSHVLLSQGRVSKGRTGLVDSSRSLKDFIQIQKGRGQQTVLFLILSRDTPKRSTSRLRRG